MANSVRSRSAPFVTVDPAYNKMNKLVEKLPKAALIIDRVGVVLCSNIQSARLLGAELSALNGKQICEILPHYSNGDLCNRFRSAHSQCEKILLNVDLAPGKPKELIFEATELEKEGECLIEFEDCSVYVSPESSELKPEFMEIFLNGAEDFFTILDSQMLNIEYVSPGVVKSLGYEPSEMVGTNANQYLKKKDLGTFSELIAAATAPPKPDMKRKHPDFFEALNISKSGKEVLLESRFKVKEGHVFCTSRDITERVHSYVNVLKSFQHTMNDSLHCVKNILFEQLEKEPDNKSLKMAFIAANQTTRVLANLSHVFFLFDNKHKVREGNFRLEELMQEVRQSRRFLMEFKKISCEIERDATLGPVLHGDRTKICEVLVNLFDNAVRHTPDGSKIKLSVAREGLDCNMERPLVRFTIKDNGPGISSKSGETFFNPDLDFIEVLNSCYHTGRVDQGLGLFISSKIFALLGGSIDYNKEAKEGAEVFGILPLGVPAAAAASVRADMQKPLEGLAVLVVDDSQMTLGILNKMVTKLGAKMVHKGKDGQQALEIVVANPEIGLIILDHMMPKMKGLEAAARLKANGATAHIPIIIASGSEAEVNVAENRAFIDGFCAKPYTSETLRHTIVDVLSPNKQSASQPKL